PSAFTFLDEPAGPSRPSATAARKAPRRPTRKGSKAALVWGLAGVVVLLVGGTVTALTLSGVFSPEPAEQEAPKQAAPPKTRQPAEPDSAMRRLRENLQGRWESAGGTDRVHVEFDKAGSIRMAPAGQPPVKGTYKVLRDGLVEVALVFEGKRLVQKLK